jgi:hypothetical protein
MYNRDQKLKSEGEGEKKRGLLMRGMAGGKKYGQGREEEKKKRGIGGVISTPRYPCMQRRCFLEREKKRNWVKGRREKKTKTHRCKTSQKKECNNKKESLKKM